MNPNYLDFEQPIADLKARIDDLKHLADADNNMNIAAEISGLEEELNFVTQRVFSRIDPWQNAQLARHPLRPHSADYIPLIFDDFEELHGDRLFADDAAIICGPAKLDGRAVRVIGKEKGSDLKEKMRSNFAMPRPEGYRKAASMMQMALSALSSAIKLSRAGLREPEKPIGSYLFSGPTGVGKTEAARQLSEILGVKLIRFDMSEYMERHTVRRLIGAPPGYIGFDQGGFLKFAVDQTQLAVLLI